MIRLRKLRIAGFRGVLDALPIDFGPKCQSIAIFGENATGKSSITDAIEWYYTDRVDHLWKENCKETALQSTLIPDSSQSIVGISYNQRWLDSVKTLSSSLASSFSNQTKEFVDYLEEIQKGQERLILRNFDLLSFVMSTKTEKRQYLAKIIGYEALDDFREVLSRTQTKLEGAPDYVAAKRNAPEYQKEMFKIAGEVISTEDGLFRAAQRLGGVAGTSISISDDEAYKAALTEISNKIGETDKAAKQLIFGDALQNCDELLNKASRANTGFNIFAALYKELTKSEEEVRQIKLETLLSLGIKTIEGGLTPTDSCPLCLQTKPWEQLRKELENRIEKLQQSKLKYQAASTEKSTNSASIAAATGAARALLATASKAGAKDEFLQIVREYRDALTALERQITQKFDNYQPLSMNLDGPTVIISAAIHEESKRLKSEIETLKLSEHEQKLLDLLRNLGLLRTAFLKHAGASETVRKFDEQIIAISKVRSGFNVIHATTLQVALDRMSENISRYYLAMHPNQHVDDVTLTVLEEGVEFEYSFHGKRVHPPLKYLSESHLNSLGIAAFLASAKLFNNINGFLVLDDIVTSFDSNHRVRLLRVLGDDFADWQILLLTHEPFWFEMIKREMTSQGWLISELEMLPGARVQIKDSAKDMKEHINSKMKDGSLTPNDLRTWLERTLKEICFALEVKLSFRYNDENERRMPGELLSELRAALRKKSPAMKDEPIFSKIETSNLIITTGSHDSGPIIAPGDIAACYDDVLALDKLFCCPNCSTYLSVERYVLHEDQIYCKCGQTKAPWKD
jgi:hypothetical protein